MSIMRKPLAHMQDAFVLPGLIAFMLAMSIIGTATITIILTNFEVVGNNVHSQQALNIAEAGINYYLWHLSHSPSDFKDGQSTPTTQTQYGYGPYTHTYIDANGVNQGTYTLYIAPQGSGSTIATVRSVGKNADGTATRTIQAQIGSPSFASYGVVSDSSLWFGNNETADGPIHSNQGVRMDGSSNAQITSANSTYTPSYSNGGCSTSTCSYAGVWCNTSVSSNCTTTQNNAQYPVSSVDFNQVSSSLCTMKKVAFGDYSATSSLASQSNACTQVPNTRTNAYIPQTTTTLLGGIIKVIFNIQQGYLIQLNNDGSNNPDGTVKNGTYDLYKVNSENDTTTPYSNALSLTLIQKQVPIPPSGVIFVEDNVWVMNNPASPSTFHGRVTIASGKLASTDSPNIVVAGPLVYSTKNGSDAIGLVAENSVYVAPYAPSLSAGYPGNFNFEVDAAILAQNGNVMYGENGDSSYPNSYRNSALLGLVPECTRGWVNPSQKMTFYGSVAVRQTWTWSWLDGRNSCGDAVYDPSINNGNGTQGSYVSGFEYNTTKYDYNLLYNPPPSYPVTGTYNIINWREVLTRP